jgi:hypothetical protein
MAIRAVTADDISWVDSLVNIAHPTMLSEDDVKIMLDTSNGRSVVWGDPDVPTFCRLSYVDVPTNHGYPFSGLCTQVAELHPRAELDVGHLETYMAPLLARALYEMSLLVPTAGPRPVFAVGLPPTIVEKWRAVFSARTAGSVIWLPRLSTAVTRSAGLRV